MFSDIDLDTFHGVPGKPNPDKFINIVGYKTELSAENYAQDDYQAKKIEAEPRRLVDIGWIKGLAMKGKKPNGDTYISAYVKKGEFVYIFESSISNPNYIPEIQDIFDKIFYTFKFKSPEVSLKCSDKGAKDLRKIPSPDGKYIAVAIDTFFGHTYISDSQGNRLTGYCPGSLGSWTLDGSKVWVFVSEAEVAEGGVFFLEPDGKFYDSGLPRGATSADIFPSNQHIVYSIRSTGSDHSDLYIKIENNNIKILEGEDTIIVQPKWSPKGDKIAFMRADLGLSTASRYLWVINSDGSGLTKLSRIDWTTPIKWSEDGSKVIYVFEGKERELNL